MTFASISSKINRLKYRPSFTLVELLVVIAIIGVMAGMLLYTLAGAQRDALTSRTQATIRKLNDIILDRWEGYRYRSTKINIPPSFLNTFVVGGQPQTALSPREAARVRMMILRDTMRMEFPDRYTDILYTPSAYNVALRTADNVDPFNDTTNDLALSPPLSRDVPGIYNNLRRKLVTTGPLTTPYTAGVGQNGFLLPARTINGIPYPAMTDSFQGAELLYQIVAMTNYNGSNGLEFFRPTEIGDLDNDGLPEFLDGWGRPIRWLRWPAGYGYVDKAALGNDQYLIDSSRPPDSALNDQSVADPLDPLRTDWRWSFTNFSQKPWMLVPLIVSAGPDGMFDLQFDEKSPLAYATYKWQGQTDSPKHFPDYFYVDPYRGYYDNSTGAINQGGLGQWIDEDGVNTTFGVADNITNYALILE